MLVSPTLYQQSVLAFRNHANILSAGGRGSGKSFGLMLDVLDYCHVYGKDASVLITRESWPALQELQTKTYELCTAAFGTKVTRNKAEGVVENPNGSKVYFTNVADADSYAKIQGRSFQMLAPDEIGNYSPTSYQLVQRIRSNLRGKPGQRIRIHATANPLGRSHHVLYKNYISQSPPWKPFREAGRPDGDYWVWTTSSVTDNPHIDQAKYIRQLTAATGHDKALALAWLTGQWTPLAGGMFAQFDPAVHVIDVPRNLPPVRMLIGGDWGTAAPSIGLLGAQLLYATHQYDKGSVLILDEVATVQDWGDLTLGDGSPPELVAQRLIDMADRNGHTSRELVMDDARGLQSETVIGIMNEAGLWATKPYKKDRAGGFALINQMLWNAANREGPGLYIDKRCRYLIETLPEAPRSELRPEDIDHRYRADHAIDALSYLLRELHDGQVTNGKTIGAW